MNKTIKILFFLLLSTSSIFADEIEELLIEDKQLDRIDINYAYTYIHPHSNGTINEGVILYDHKMWKGFTTLFQLGFYDRKEGKGTLGTVSAFWDWSDEFYTFTSYAHGTKSSYLPNNKVEQTFFYKCGCERNFIVSLGLTYIGYYHDRSDISVIPESSGTAENGSSPTITTTTQQTQEICTQAPTNFRFSMAHGEISSMTSISFTVDKLICWTQTSSPQELIERLLVRC
jgi:hypothetical protein